MAGQSEQAISRPVTVTVATDKIALELTTYQDALLVAPKQTSRVNIDPRVLSNIECKAKQILVNIYDIEGNNTMAKSLHQKKKTYLIPTYSFLTPKIRGLSKK